MVKIYIFFRKILDTVMYYCAHSFPTPPEQISTPLNFLNPPPPGKFLKSPPPQKFLNFPPKKFSTPTRKFLNPPQKISTPKKYVNN